MFPFSWFNPRASKELAKFPGHPWDPLWPRPPPIPPPPRERRSDVATRAVLSGGGGEHGPWRESSVVH